MPSFHAIFRYPQVQSKTFVSHPSPASTIPILPSILDSPPAVDLNFHTTSLTALFRPSTRSPVAAASLSST
jgi:hypothetical protein